MNILRLSTHSLTLAIAVITLGYNPSFAGKPDSEGNHDHGDDPSVLTYTADLTGAFVFNEVLTVNSQETVLTSTDSVTVDRPDESSASTEAALWDSVFAQCNIFFGPTPVDVPRFTAPAGGKGWTIEKPGGIRVNFRKIPLSIPNIGDVEVTLSLIGETPYSDPFLPVDPDTTITHELTRFEVQGTTAKKVKPRLVCHDESVPGSGDLTTPSILTITAT